MRRFNFFWYKAVYDSAASKAGLADAALATVADDPSRALYYQGACEVWLALADLVRSLDAIRVRPSVVRRELEDLSLELRRFLDGVVDDAGGSS